jgi:membrane-bound serine protease (ClpP class)
MSVFMRHAARFSFALIAPLLALTGFAGTSTAAAAPAGTTASVLVVKVDGSIDAVQAGYLIDSLDQAQADGSTVVIQLDSAGTLDQDAIGLAQRIHDSRVPVVVWVGPVPAKAQGAALLFMYASSLAAVAPGAGLGPLEPLDLVDRRDATFPGPTEIEAMATRWAEEFHKPVPVVFPEQQVPAQDALDGHIAQVTAVSITDLLSAVDGRTVWTAAGETRLETAIARDPSQTPVTVRFTSLGPVDRVLHAAASPAAIYVLLVFGLAALAFELTQPGFGFAGFAGIAMVALAVYGLTVVPFSWPGMVLLVGGVGLMTLDVRVRKLGVLTGLGVLAFLAGSLLLFADVAPAIRLSPWLIGALTVSSLLYYGFALTVAVQSRERITSTQKGLVGLVGEARGNLDPEGPVFVKGTLWRGRSSAGPIAQGARVRVRGVDGLILRVEPEPEVPVEPSPQPIAGD